jgi:hypothetical protein
MVPELCHVLLIGTLLLKALTGLPVLPHLARADHAAVDRGILQQSRLSNGKFSRKLEPWGFTEWIALHISGGEQRQENPAVEDI